MTRKGSELPICVGIDVGERSVGFATVEYDDDGWPISILNSVVHIHDGGLDHETAKSPQSRLATSGVARRTRRLIRNRRRRLQKLDSVLSETGLPVPREAIPQMHEAWRARATLVERFINDEDERKHQVSLAIRHIARHRGWRNPWWTYDQLHQAPSPSTSLTETMNGVHTKLGIALDGVETMGQLVARVLTGLPSPYSIAIRPTNNAEQSDTGPVQTTRVMQEDSLHELRLILETQQIDPTQADLILRAVFHQEYPHVPKDRIGRCALQPDQPRASHATLEFQEFRVRSTVANLRIGRQRLPLTPEQHDSVVEFLLSWDDSVNRPRWIEVAEFLQVRPRDLIDISPDGSGSSVAVHNRTSAVMLSKFKKSSPLGQWWRSASDGSKSVLIEIVADVTGSEAEFDDSEIAALLEEIDPSTFDGLSTTLESGRAAYCVDTLRKLNDVMREQRVDVHEARKIAFGVDDTWTPPRPSFDDHVEHPTVRTINTIVRRYLMNITQRFGPPDRVVVEHVRGAFMGPSALAEHNRETQSNANRRDKLRASLREQGIQNTSDATLRRHDAIERQGSTCLYCGAPIGLETCELDHIVPRNDGGSNRLDNLVAVCRSCNQAKGKVPFAVWAQAQSNPEVSVDAAQRRVKDWTRAGMPVRPFTRLQGDVKRRLALTEDESVDERSLASTAYAAREMRFRVQTYLDSPPPSAGDTPRTCVVYSGRTSSEARKASGVDDALRLRGAQHKTRFDRRHHAIDAAILTSLNDSVATTLATRAAMQYDHRMTDKAPGWKHFTGSTPTSQQKFAEWSERTHVLSGLLTQAIEGDQVPVMRPLRLSPRIGSIHEETIYPLERKNIEAPFSIDDIFRITDPRLYKAMIDLSEGQQLGEDDERSEKVDWPPDRPVELFPSNAAYLSLRHGAVKIGSSAKFAQVFAWPRNRGGFDFGMIRLYVGEFPRIGFGRKGSNFLRDLPPPHSQAWRTIPKNLRDRIESGDARYVGWLCINDEIEIDPIKFSGADKMGLLLQHYPESHWIVTGLFNDRTVSLAPAHLASEGIVTSDEGSAPAARLAPTPAEVAQILQANRIPLSINRVLSTPGTCVVRRTALGKPRWDSTSLPTSWRPLEAAQNAFA